MAGLGQFHSFIGKFVSLWQAGLDASLEFRTCDGEARAHLHVGLGQVPRQQKAQPQQGAARFRRRVRRADARRLVAEEAAQVDARNAAEEPVQVEARLAAEEAPHVEARHAEEAAQVEETTAGEAGNNDSEAGNGEVVNYAAGEAVDDLSAANSPTAASKAVAAMEVNDELCPDSEFEETDGKTAFRCLQCKIVYIPGTYMHGDTILEINQCRGHNGVIKCENCRMDLVGMQRIKSHRETCHEPA